MLSQHLSSPKMQRLPNTFTGNVYLNTQFILCIWSLLILTGQDHQLFYHSKKVLDFSNTLWSYFWVTFIYSQLHVAPDTPDWITQVKKIPAYKFSCITVICWRQQSDTVYNKTNIKKTWANKSTLKYIKYILSTDKIRLIVAVIILRCFFFSYSLLNIISTLIHWLQLKMQIDHYTNKVMMSSPPFSNLFKFSLLVC